MILVIHTSNKTTTTNNDNDNTTTTTNNNNDDNDNTVDPTSPPSRFPPFVRSLGTFRETARLLFHRRLLNRIVLSVPFRESLEFNLFVSICVILTVWLRRDSFHSCRQDGEG